MSSNQLAMVMIFAGGFLFGGVATLLLRWWRGMQDAPDISPVQHNPDGSITMQHGLTCTFREPPIPYKPQGGPVPGAPVTREEYGMLVARLDRILGSAEREIERVTVAQDALNNRVAAIVAAQAHELPGGVRVWGLGELCTYFRVWDGRAMWAKYKDDDRDWFDDAPNTPGVMDHLRELHGPEALAVYEDWKARVE